MMIIITACLTIIIDGVSGSGDAHDRRDGRHRWSEHAERPRQECRTRSRAPFGLRSCGCEDPRIGPPALLHSASVAVPRLCDAPGQGPTDCLRQGCRFVLGRARIGAARPPRCNPITSLFLGDQAGRKGDGVLRLTPNAQMGFGGKTVISLSSRWLSEISIAIA